MEILRYAAFSSDPNGGNPAGVVLDATGADDTQMQAAAARIGYSETAFVFPRPGDDSTFDVRYFSPLAEVPFCGHATVALTVAYARAHQPGPLTLHTRSGTVTVSSTRLDNDELVATLVSVPPRVVDLPPDDLSELLTILRWETGDLDPALPPGVAFAGAWHPILATATRDRLSSLDYDFDALKVLMAERDWTTIDLVHRESPTEFRVRNPFPPGGVVEDPATGAAAAAFGGYLRELGLVDVPARLTIRQGEELGRPSLLTVDIPADLTSGIQVTGTAVEID